ncbi:MAG: hypothetical protein AABW67_01705 [Nanoarchaeota archaeon]
MIKKTSRPKFKDYGMYLFAIGILGFCFFITFVILSEGKIITNFLSQLDKPSRLLTPFFVFLLGCIFFLLVPGIIGVVVAYFVGYLRWKQHIRIE